MNYNFTKEQEYLRKYQNILHYRMAIGWAFRLYHTRQHEIWAKHQIRPVLEDASLKDPLEFSLMGMGFDPNSSFICGNVPYNIVPSDEHESFITEAALLDKYGLEVYLLIINWVLPLLEEWTVKNLSCDETNCHCSDDDDDDSIVYMRVDDEVQLVSLERFKNEFDDENLYDVELPDWGDSK